MCGSSFAYQHNIRGYKIAVEGEEIRLSFQKCSTWRVYYRTFRNPPYFLLKTETAFMADRESQ